MSDTKQARVPAVDTVALAPVVDRLCREATLRTAFPPGGKVADQLEGVTDSANR